MDATGNRPPHPRDGVTDRDPVEVVWEYWRAVMAKPRAILDAKRARRIGERLEENGGDVGELLYAIDGAAKDDWLMGRDPRNAKVYNGIDTVLRDRAQIERLAELCGGYRRNETHPQLRGVAPDVGG